jgi:hypothetical protein
MKKGKYQPPNIKLIEFHKFWWICIYAGVYQEKEVRYQGCQVKSIFHRGTKLRRI